MSKTNTNWQHLFKEHFILEKINNNGFFVITSEQINKYREARLMTKFDHKNNLPALFQEYELSILPITRGSYIISKFEAYKDINYEVNKEIIEIPFPSEIESIDFSNIYSESAALNCAYSTGIIDDFLGETTLPTVSGRMGSSAFDFNIRNVGNNNSFHVSVENSQVEIDGGYEGISQLMLIEAKNAIAQDFLIRQLYYPFRLWNSKINKDVVPVFMTYSNDIFSFFKYKFEDEREYNSLSLIEQKNYVIAPEKITLEDIVQVFKNIIIIPEPRISYPQADSFERVINLLEMLMEEDIARDEVTHIFDVDPRQTNYYTSAGMYLGMVDKRREGKIVTYYLTDEARRIMNLPYKKKYLSIVGRVLRNPSFYRVFELYLKNGYQPSRKEIVQIMKTSDIYDVHSADTFNRRASTVRGWLNWILNLQNQR